MGRDEAGSDDAVFEQLSRLRRGLVERMWRAFFYLALTMLPILLWRAYDIRRLSQSGSALTNLTFIVLACVLLGLYPFRGRIPFRWKAAMPILILSITGLVSVLVFGAASIAFCWLVQSNFLLSTLYSMRAGITATVLTALTALVVGLLFLSGVLVSTVDLNLYFAQPTSWLLFLLGTTVVPTVILYSIGGYQRTIGQLLTQVQAKRDMLSEMSTQLSEALAAQERANAAKSTFLAHMTHELRTPLSGVIGMLDIAERRNADPAVARLLTVAQHNAEALLKVINDVLDYSKIDADKLTLQPENFDLPEFVQTSLQVFHWRAREKGLSFSCEVDEQLARWRYADVARIRQVLFNLVSNAMKYTDAGSVGVSVRAAADGPDADARVLFEIRDTGVGIAPQELPRLFGEFVQVGTNAQRHRGGTGLGLTISQLLVTAMGGEIRVRSTPGEGSTFTVDLPLPLAQPESPHAPAAPHTAEPPAEAVQLNVLLAEDSPTNQLVVTMQLQDLGHRVVVADNGQMAIECAARENFDLILMDLRMPVLAGMEAAAVIRQGGSAQTTVFDRDVYICALTANSSPADRASALSVGMNDFLTKPVRVEELQRLMGRVTAFQRQRGIPLAARWPAAAHPVAEADHLLAPSTDTAPDPPGAPDEAVRQARLRDLFQGDLLSQLSQLVQSVADGHWDQASEIAHRVKGAARIMGEQSLATAAAELESACQEPDDQMRMHFAKVLVRSMENYLEDKA